MRLSGIRLGLARSACFEISDMDNSNREAPAGSQNQNWDYYFHWSINIFKPPHWPLSFVPLTPKQIEENEAYVRLFRDQGAAANNTTSPEVKH